MVPVKGELEVVGVSSVCGRMVGSGSLMFSSGAVFSEFSSCGLLGSGGGGGRGGLLFAIAGHVSVAIAFSADHFWTSSARMPDRIALTADRLLVCVDYPAPFVADFNRVRDGWF